ncbi:periplasmic heavy metal sensor [Roseobacter cerasinus]|nr:periplasmic heavy metal sensor [Roseobacter cerasinus]
MTKSRVSRRIKIILGVSLGLNLAVLGLVGGTLLRHGEGKLAGLHGVALGGYGLPYMIALPRQDRRVVVRSVRSSPEALDRVARRALYNDVLMALRRPELDLEALSVAVRRQAEASIIVQRRAQTAWLDVISDMPAKERVDYAAAIEEVLRRGPKGRK